MEIALKNSLFESSENIDEAAAAKRATTVVVNQLERAPSGPRSTSLTRKTYYWHDHTQGSSTTSIRFEEEEEAEFRIRDGEANNRRSSNSFIRLASSNKATQLVPVYYTPTKQQSPYHQQYQPNNHQLQVVADILREIAGLTSDCI